MLLHGQRQLLKVHFASVASDLLPGGALLTLSSSKGLVINSGPGYGKKGSLLNAVVLANPSRAAGPCPLPPVPD